MSNVVITPNMNLPEPVVGTDPGPDWANNINACLNAIDAHTHTAGSGVPITPAAINVNADLAMNNNNLVTTRTVRFQPQSSTPANAADLGILFEKGVDLYYTDGAGNVIRITQGGSVSGATGTITGLPSGTASAAYSTGTFTFQAATNTPAALNIGPITLGQMIASGFNVTISASASQASNYNLTLPTGLPGSTMYMISDSSGNLGFTNLPTATISVPGIAVLPPASTDIVPGLALTPMKYLFGNSYPNGTPGITSISGFGTIMVATGSWIIPYKSYDGSWFVRFQINFSSSGVTNGSIALSGLTFIAAVNQACSAVGVQSAVGGYCETTPNTANLFIASNSISQNNWCVGGDVEIQAKPTWAD